MKRLLPLLLLCTVTLVAAGPGAYVVLDGGDGPRAVSAPSDPAVALRLLIAGDKTHASYFPRGTTFDGLERNADGFALLVTFPTGAALDETVTDPMMHALGETMHTVAPGTPCKLMARFADQTAHRPIGKLLTRPVFTRSKPGEDAGKANGPPGFSQPQASGFLAGKSVFLAPGHGWYWNDDLAAWITQRPNTNGIVEDFSNPEPVLQYLQPYLHNAGALVYTVRERDMNTAMAIVDNNDPAFSSSGGWFSSTSVGDYYGEDYLAVEVAPEATAFAAFPAEIDTDGFYHVYVWYTAGENRATDCHITVQHADGDSVVIQNLRRDAFTWKDLGRYYFRTADPPQRRRVVIDNRGADPGTFVVADAVRFGGGTHEGSGKPRWEMSGLYYAPFMGCTACATNTVTTMPRLTKWEHESWEDGIYLSWHTNAPNPGTGTSSFAYASGGWDAAFDGVPGSLALRAAVHAELVGDIRAGWSGGWTDRGEHTNWYGEINPNYNDETPGIIFEVAFHDTPADAEDLKQPGFRKLAARAVYQGVVRYYATRDGMTPRFLPEPPEALAVVWNDGDYELTWQPPPYDNGGLAGDAAEGYRVYVSRTGKGSADAIEVPESSARLGAPADAVGLRYVRVAAFNEGGESFPTPTLAIATGSGPRVLIVDGFDRLDSAANVPESYYGGGTIYRGYLDRMNSFDYVIAHAEALAAAGVAFDSAADDAVVDGAVDLFAYPAVVWIVGEDSTADRSLGPDAQALLAEYLDAGGALFVSGSEIGWDLWQNGNASDQAFFTNYLRAAYVADSSDTGVVHTSGLFAGIGAFDFDFLDYEIYAADYPDVIEALPGGATDLAYVTGDGAAVVTDTGLFRIVYLGFPFETIFHPAARQEVMAAAMDFLLAPGDDDDDDDDDNDDDDNNNDNDDNDDDDDSTPLTDDDDSSVDDDDDDDDSTPLTDDDDSSVDDDDVSGDRNDGNKCGCG
jgi:hypothetical protein